MCLCCCAQVLQPPHGVVYVAAKAFYFGVGGSTTSFAELVKADGVLECTQVRSTHTPAAEPYGCTPSAWMSPCCCLWVPQVACGETLASAEGRSSIRSVWERIELCLLLMCVACNQCMHRAYRCGRLRMAAATSGRSSSSPFLRPSHPTSCDEVQQGCELWGERCLEPAPS